MARKSKMVWYEMMLILKPLLPDDLRKTIHQSIVKLCKDLEGEVNDVDVWGKRYLAYKIDVNNEGYYLVYTFSLPTKSMKEFKRKIDLKDEIMRYLLIKVDEDKIKKNSIKKKEMEVNI